MRYLVFGLMLSCFASLAGAQGFSRDIRAIDPASPISGTIALGDVAQNGDRLRLELAGRFPALLDELDTQMRARGNLGDECGVRLFWTGPTRFRQGGETLRLTGRARFELWGCVKIFGSTTKTRMLESTHDLELSLQPVWDADERKLWLDVRLDNIREFPGEGEQILRRAGVKFSKRVDVPLGDQDRLRQLDPQLESYSFEQVGDRGAGLSVTLSADRLSLIDLLREEAGIDIQSMLSQSLRRFGGWLFGD